MAIKVISWDEHQAKQKLSSYLKFAKEYRKQFEDQWRENEQLLYNAVGYRQAQVSTSFSSEAELPDEPQDDVGVNDIFRYVRFIHAQMSANPPAAQASPGSQDPRDRQAAIGADRTVRWLRKQLELGEKQDQQNLKAITKGSGWMKTVWDANLGTVKDFDKATQMVTMSGDFLVYSPSTWNMWIDPDATSLEKLNWVIERHQLPLEEAVALNPAKEDELKGFARIEPLGDRSETKDWLFTGRAKRAQTDERELVDIYEYYERATPFNGMAGRHAWFLEDGTLLKPMEANPHWEAKLPYHLITDVDVEDQVYGKSFIEYNAIIQDIKNRLDGQTLDNIKAHHVTRLYQPQGCDIADESISNLGLEIIKGTGPNKPDFINPPQSMPDAVRFRADLSAGGEATAGVNESMFGQVNREMSSLSLQTAINAGNTVRRRLYNKYTRCVEGIYRHLLGLAIMHWSVPRAIRVLGEENSFEVIDLKGSDLEGGWDITVEYGTSLSLDPATRREEILQLVPMLKEAGFSMASILDMIRLNEVGEVYDRATLGRRRQREIFDTMIGAYMAGKPVYLAPEELQDHPNYLDYAQTYLQTAQFSKFEPELKALLRQHVKDRAAMASASAGAVSQPPVPQMPPEGLGAPPPQAPGTPGLPIA